MKTVLLIMIAVMGLLGGEILAQQSGTINNLSVNPRQNQELTNSTGTETGQPADAVVGSESEPNGLVPVTSNMVGSGSNSNARQPASTEGPASASTSTTPTAERPPARSTARNSKARP